MRPADQPPADMPPADMRAANMRPADVRRPEPTAAAVSAKPAVSATTMPATTMPAATATGVCFKCDKRHDEEQHCGQASAGRQHQPHGAAGLGAPHHCGRLNLGILPRMKSL